ncbi:MAG: class I SAM-dependent methyltransferase [Erythrobacter sp.]
MRAIDQWKPTKFEQRKGRWRYSLDPRELARSSRVSSSLALEALEGALKRHARGHLADFGCGKVPFYGIYCGQVAEVTCIDWPNSSHESSHIDIEADLNHPVDVADATFDTIFCSSVLEHIWDHRTLWREMTRSLKSGGTMIMGVPFIYGLHEVPYDYFRWTRYAFEKACEENGLEIIELEPYGGGIDVVADLLVRSLAIFGNRLAGGLGRVATFLLRGGRSKRLAPEAFEALPLGYLLVARKPAS